MANRRFLTLKRPGWSPPRVALWALASLTFVISVVIVPYLFERQDADWLKYLDSAPRPLTLEERFIQFDVDIPGWVRATAGFPAYYSEDSTRIDRPVYLLIGTILPRLVTIVTNLPDLGRGFTRPANEIVTFASLLLLNYVLFIFNVQFFFTWLRDQRHFSLGVSFIAAAMLAVSPWAFVQNLKTTPNIFAVTVILAILYLFDRYLLADEPPGWGRIAWVSLVVGVLMLGKAQYDALFLVWLWALSLRRWRVLVGSMVIHFVPLAIWAGLLALGGLRYYNHETEVYHQVIWMWEVFRAGGLSEVYYLAMNYGATALGGLALSFSVLDLLLAGYVLIFRQTVLPAGFKRLAAFSLLGVVGLVALLARPLPYLVYDMFVVMYPLAAVGLWDLIQRLQEALRLQTAAGHRLTVWLAALFFAVNVPVGWAYLSLDRAIYAWRPALGKLLDLLR